MLRAACRPSGVNCAKSNMNTLKHRTLLEPCWERDLPLRAPTPNRAIGKIPPRRQLPSGGRSSAQVLKDAGESGGGQLILEWVKVPSKPGLNVEGIKQRSNQQKTGISHPWGIPAAPHPKRLVVLSLSSSICPRENRLFHACKSQESALRHKQPQKTRPGAAVFICKRRSLRRPRTRRRII